MTLVGELPVKLLFLIGSVTRDDNLELYVCIAPAAAALVQPLSPQTQPLAALCARGHFEFRSALERGHLDRGTQNSLPRGDWYLRSNVIAGRCKDRMSSNS